MMLGAILAGGRSTRFGSDKAMAVLNGRALIDHVAGHLATVTARIVICGRDYPGILSIPDRPAPELGPLAGLNAALHYARAHGYTHVLSAPCDTPLLDPALLAALVAGNETLYLSEMPVIGRWHSADAVLLDDHLQSGCNRSMRAWAERVGAGPLDHLPPPNVNRPLDLAALGG